ncbi:MAG: hypothetical protein JNK48_22460 [Bryobacterales bacterium]|nr:hypothetical protein [Bryobacterales bacterium]
MQRAVLLLALALPMTSATSRYDAMPTQRKIDLIEQGRIPAGTMLTFEERELNVYLQKKSREVIPDGLREPHVTLNDGRVTGKAFVDFVKMRHAQGEDMNWLMSSLLKGEYPIRVEGRVASSKGTARVDLDVVQVGGASLKGRALDLLVRTFVLPLYPNAKVGTQFELGYNVDRIELKPGAAQVVIAGKETGAKR